MSPNRSIHFHNSFRSSSLFLFEDKQTFDVGKYDRTYFGNYIKAQNYADAALGRFIERLKEMGLYENSLIVIYGDHTGLPKTQAKELLEFWEWTTTRLTG